MWDGSTWMYDNWHEIASQNITEIIIPGSHNSGTACLSNDTSNDHGGRLIRKCAFWFGQSSTYHVAKKWSACQPWSILEQLQSGLRYLDLRIGVDTNQTLPSKQLRVCHGFFAESIEMVLQQVVDFCIVNTNEFVVLDFQKLYFHTVNSSHSKKDIEQRNLILVTEIETRLRHYLVSAKTWHMPLSTLQHTRQRVFIFYPVEKNSASWWRDWMIPRHFVNSVWPNVTGAQFIKERMDLFIRVNEEKKQKIAANNTSIRHGAMFVLQGIVTERPTQVFLGIISSSLTYLSKGWVTFWGYPCSIEEQSRDVNSTVMGLVEKTYNPSFLNVILLDWANDTNLTQRIAMLNVAKHHQEMKPTLGTILPPVQPAQHKAWVPSILKL